MHRLIRRQDYREGRWRNGLGVSWEIASQSNAVDIASQGDAADFAWRLALAKIDRDVAFSDYPNTDRVFTIIDGAGVTLDVEGQAAISAMPFVPMNFPGDRPTMCRLTDGSCLALNLFVRRFAFTSEVRIVAVSGGSRVTLPGGALVFALSGSLQLDDWPIGPEDTVVTGAATALAARQDSRIWQAVLRRNDGPR